MAKHVIADLRQVGGGIELSATTTLTSPSATAWEPVINGFTVLMTGSATGVTAIIEISETDPAVSATPFTLDTLTGAAPLEKSYSWTGPLWARVRLTAISGSLVAVISGQTSLQAVPVPSIVTQPTISGTLQVGQTLSVPTGSWSGSPSVYAYQWFGNGKPIAGATTSTYTQQASDLWTLPSCQIIATNEDGPSLPLIINAAGQVQPGVLAPIGPLSASFAAGAAPGATLLSFTGTEAGAIYKVRPDDGCVVASGTSLVAGLQTLSPGVHTYVVKKELAGYTTQQALVALTVTGSGVVAPTLGTLTLSPLTATAGVAYSGTISGATAGSTVTATSADGTALTVGGSGATRTVSGTFASSGAKAISMPEALAGAIGSPKTSSATITVSPASASPRVSPLTAGLGLAFAGAF